MPVRPGLGCKLLDGHGSEVSDPGERKAGQRALKRGLGHFLHGETRRFHWDRCWSRKSGTLTLPIWPDWLANFGKDRDLLSIFSSSFFLFLEMVGFITKTGYTAKIAISIGKIASNQWGLTIYHCVYIYISKTGVKSSVSIKKSGQSLHS